MQRIILTSWFITLVIGGFAQITLQKTYDYSASIVKLETMGYKYYLMDVPNSQCRIYNMDHTIFKTIQCSVPTGYYLADIKFVSEKIFNTDTQIELAYTYYKLITTSNSYYYIYGAKIISENGSVLQNIDNAQYIYINQTGDEEYKLFAYCFDYSISPEKVWTNIYDIPGTLNASISNSGGYPDVFFNAFPNPATEQIRLVYELPINVKSAKLFLVDSNGRMLRNFQIDGHSDHITLNISDLSSGIYYYFIEYDKYRSASKKIIVQ